MTSRGHRAAAVAGTAAWLVIAPGTLAGLLPWWITGWVLRPPFIDAEASRWAGLILILPGAAVLLEAFARFALNGLGTPAPVMPPQRLVVTGPYRHVRNPMYVGVVAVVLGQALLFASAALLAYAAVLWLGFHLFVVAYEEPTLRARYGAEYEAFRGGVPRWLPRLSPWSPPRL